MRRITEKLHSRRGASLIYALLLFLVASMVSAVILSASVTAAKRLRDDQIRQQNELTINSGARLLKKLMTQEYAVTVTEDVPGDGPRFSAGANPVCEELCAAVEEVWGRGEAASASHTINVHVDSMDDDVTLTFRMTEKKPAKINETSTDYYYYYVEGTITAAGMDDKLYLTGYVTHSSPPLPTVTYNYADDVDKEGNPIEVLVSTTYTWKLTWTVDRLNANAQGA